MCGLWVGRVPLRETILVARTGPGRQGVATQTNFVSGGGHGTDPLILPSAFAKLEVLRSLGSEIATSSYMISDSARQDSPTRKGNRPPILLLPSL